MKGLFMKLLAGAGNSKGLWKRPWTSKSGKPLPFLGLQLEPVRCGRVGRAHVERDTVTMRGTVHGTVGKGKTFPYSLLPPFDLGLILQLA